MGYIEKKRDVHRSHEMSTCSTFLFANMLRVSNKTPTGNANTIEFRYA